MTIALAVLGIVVVTVLLCVFTTPPSVWTGETPPPL